MIFKKKILSLLTLALCLAVGSFAYIHSLHAAEEEVDLTTSTPKLIQEVKTNVYSSTTPNGDLNLEGLENDEGIVPESVPQEKMIVDPNDILQKIDDDLYRHPKLGYTFKSPQNWNVYQVPNMSYVRVENKDVRQWDSFSKAEKENYFKIEVVVLPKNDLSLESWIEQQNALSVYTPPKVIEQREVEVDGHRAVYQIEELASGKIHPVVFIEQGDHIYLLNIASSYENHLRVSEEFIENFKFSNH